LGESPPRKKDYGEKTKRKEAREKKGMKDRTMLQDIQQMDNAENVRRERGEKA